MSLVLLLFMYCRGRRRDPRWSCFHVNTSPLENFHSVICLQNPTCHFEYVALSCNLYFVCLLVGCNFGEALRAIRAASCPNKESARRHQVSHNCARCGTSFEYEEHVGSELHRSVYGIKFQQGSMRL